MEKAKARKIKKWDEVHGEYEVEVSEESVHQRRLQEQDHLSAEIPCVELKIWWSRMIITLMV